MNERVRSILECYREWKTEVLGQKPDPVPRLPLRIPYEMAWD